MNESEFYSQHVGPAINAVGICDRVESSVGGGIPDVNFAIDATQGWLELKIAHAGQLYFEKFQIPWMRRRLRHQRGRGVWVVATDQRVVWLIPASSVVAAPREHKGKWSVVQLSDLAFEAILETKPWRWDPILNIISGKPFDPNLTQPLA